MADTLKQKLDRIEGKASLLAKKIAELKQSRNASVSITPAGKNNL